VAYWRRVLNIVEDHEHRLINEDQFDR
jgi:hypothetical protein